MANDITTITGLASRAILCYSQIPRHILNPTPTFVFKRTKLVHAQRDDSGAPSSREMGYVRTARSSFESDASTECALPPLKQPWELLPMPYVPAREFRSSIRAGDTAYRKVGERRPRK